ncbi:MAG: IclR family transcriptional regulator [Oscillospiraceae bacterium]|nr:IclR family transcriptional regulator [Oscillospiraceae bacterium]
MPEKQPQYINSIIRALNILELFSKLNVQSLGIAEISRELGLQKTSTFNIVKTLQHQGWLIQDGPNGKYMLGSRILPVSMMVTRNFTTEDIILQEMHRLRDLYNEDVVLTAMVDGIPICVEKVHSANILRIQSQVGRVSNFVKGSTGKALFAWQPEAFVTETLDRLFDNTPQSQQARRAIVEQMEQIRRQGYCISVSEQDEGVMSVSVPIFDEQGYARYSLAVIGEEHRFRQKGMDAIRDDVIETCKRLTESLRFIHN